MPNIEVTLDGYDRACSAVADIASQAGITFRLVEAAFDEAPRLSNGRIALKATSGEAVLGDLAEGDIRWLAYDLLNRAQAAEKLLLEITKTEGE